MCLRPLIAGHFLIGLLVIFTACTAASNKKPKPQGMSVAQIRGRYSGRYINLYRNYVYVVRNVQRDTVLTVSASPSNPTQALVFQNAEMTYDPATTNWQGHAPARPNYTFKAPGGFQVRTFQAEVTGDSICYLSATQGRNYYEYFRFDGKKIP